MLIYPLKNWSQVQRTLFLTGKNKEVYAYAYSDQVYIGSAEEIYSELKDKGIDKTEEDSYYFMGPYKIPRSNNSFLTMLQIKCIN